MSRSRRIARAFAVAVAVVAVGFGAQRADAALVASANLGARPSVTCWADIGYPNHVGSNVVSFNDWQCSPGIEQQISLVASLTYQDGTRYQFTKTCYSTQSCSVNPMSAPWQSGTWTAKADYAFVVAYDNTSSYWSGGQISQYLPY
ncbi:MAG: hypothetical protein JF589_13215 [Gemmatimonadetes bacterium]|nr:hypothetical protein [Gemmatimonadota bacterium]